MRHGEHEVEQMAMAGDHEGRRCMYVCMYVCVCVSVSVRTYLCMYECICVIMCRRVRDNEGTEKGTMKLQVEAGLYELRSSESAAAGGSTSAPESGRIVAKRFGFYNDFGVPGGQGPSGTMKRKRVQSKMSTAPQPEPRNRCARLPGAPHSFSNWLNPFAVGVLI